MPRSTTSVHSSVNHTFTCPSVGSGPLETAQCGEGTGPVRSIREHTGPLPTLAGEPTELCVPDGHHRGHRVPEQMVRQGRVVGECGDVQAGSPHRHERVLGVPVAVRQQGVVVQVGMDQRRTTGDPRAPPSALRRGGGAVAGLGQRRAGHPGREQAGCGRAQQGSPPQSGRTGEVQRLWAPLFARYDVPLVLAGHDPRLPTFEAHQRRHLRRLRCRRKTAANRTRRLHRRQHVDAILHRHARLGQPHHAQRDRPGRDTGRQFHDLTLRACLDAAAPPRCV